MLDVAAQKFPVGYQKINQSRPPEDMFAIGDKMTLFVLDVCKIPHLCLLCLFGAYSDECVLEPNKGFVMKERFLRIFTWHTN